MRFLAGADIQTHVRTIASRNGEVMAAVAYWGSGAAERTGLTEHDRPASVRVICDLLSGACNPAEIQALKKLGFSVKTLDRLHAKVWIGGDDVIVGSANASRNGLPSEDEQGAKANVEAAVLSQDPRFARELKAWFEKQWRASCEIDDQHLDEARQLWKRRRRSGGRGFTSPLTEEIQNSGSRDRFSDLRLLAYLSEETSQEAENYIGQNAGHHYTDDEWQEFGDDKPWYEWPRGNPEWPHPPGTVFANFSCSTEGEEFAFNGYWQLRHCPSIELKKNRLTLLNKLPHINGYSLSRQEQASMAWLLRVFVARRNHEIDEFESYIDENLLAFWEREHGALRQRLVAQVVEAARELCRTDRFDPSLTLRAIRVCMKDPAWLSGYAGFVGDDIYQHGNYLKKGINPKFGQLVKAGVGAEDQEDENGQPVTAEVEGEIIQSYTLFRDYDPTTVE